jgi:hypothetical protein
MSPETIMPGLCDGHFQVKIRENVDPNNNAKKDCKFQ